MRSTHVSSEGLSLPATAAASSPTRCLSPLNNKPPRRIELAPLATASTPYGSNNLAESSSSSNGDLDLPSLEELRIESPRYLYSTRSPKSTSRSPKKVYPRLQTIAQLAETHVSSMHNGEFVFRSVDRWREFGNYASNQRGSKGESSSSSNRCQSEQMSDDARRAFTIARETGAIVIQSAWRRFVAVSVREKLVSAIWKRQMDLAAWISARYELFQTRLQQLEDHSLQRRSSNVPTPSQSLLGAFYHLPATLLTMWLCFMCAKANGHFLRQSPVVLQTIDIPVRRTFKVVTRLWHKASMLAALSVQCCFRSFLARKMFRRIHAEFLRYRATLRLQCFFRVRLARKVALRLRRRHASICIQCCWRCYRARACACHQRILYISRKFWSVVCAEAVGRAAQAIFELAARNIQRVYRGQKARNRVRWLTSIKEQKNWLKNPSKGYMLFTEQQYNHAALSLEYCLRQGFVQDLQLSAIAENEVALNGNSGIVNHQNLVSGSRMSFSFSSAPTQLSHPDWLQNYGNANVDESDTLKCLKFWLTYAFSHFQVYEAAGRHSNLEQSRLGWESFLSVCKNFVTGDKVFKNLRFQVRFYLLLCIFWVGGANERRKALELSHLLLHEINTVESAVIYEDEQSHQHSIRDIQAQLMITSSMIHFELKQYAQCCQRLEQLLAFLPHPRYSELEVRFVLGLVLCKQLGESGIKPQLRPDATKTVAEEKIHENFTRCYQIIELWPSVGYFHGQLTSEEAKQKLASSPVGSFLLHTSAVKAGSDAAVKDGTDPIATASGTTRQDLYLKVKLSDRPHRITSMRIKTDDAGLYFTKKIPKSKHSSVHKFVACLPEAAGVIMENGIQKKLFEDALKKKLEHGCTGSVSERSGIRHKMLSWKDWKRWIKEEYRFPKSRAVRRNESWAAVCLEIARVLECSQSWVFSEFVAKEAVLCSKDRYVRANANFIAARCAFHLHNYPESKSFMRHAELSSANGGCATDWRCNLRAVNRALSRNVTVSRQETFDSQLERVQKLERMCLKAWRRDSLSVTLRGDSFSEALLLQRIHIEMYSACADTFFLRSLLKAHIRAYLASGALFEKAHLEYAIQCVAQLFVLFREHHENGGRTYKSQINALETLLSHPVSATRSHLRGFSVDHLLLLWHRIPFVVCFELSEALYRSSAAFSGNSNNDPVGSRVIDMYESLYGRLRGSKPQTNSYSAFEELILVRLAFLYAQKSTVERTSARYLRSAVKLVDELLSQRKKRERKSAHQRTKKPKKIKWPCTLTLPSRLSSAELAFTRGFLLEMLEDMKQIPREERKSWHDYNELHTELMAIVAEQSKVNGSKAQPLHRNQQQPRGIRLFVGETQDLAIKNLFHSKPFISIQCEGKTVLSQTQPTWMSLSPSWNEFIEFELESSKSRLVVSLVDRLKRTSSLSGGDQVIGAVQLHAQELIDKSDVYAVDKFFDLSVPTRSDDDSYTREAIKTPTIFLGLQILFKPHEPNVKLKHEVPSKRICGNWELGELRANLHGDLETFLRSRWIWSWFGRLWMGEQEYSIANWFLHKAVRIAEASFQVLGNNNNNNNNRQRQQQNAQDREIILYAQDLVALVACYKATMSREHWAYYAAPLLESAEVMLQNAIYAGMIDASDHSVQKLLDSIDASKQEAGSIFDSGPLVKALGRNTPASSDWVKIPVDTEFTSSNDATAYFFNLDTGEHFVPHSGALEPLEYEDKEFLKRCNFEAVGQKPHRIVIMSQEMKARVLLHRHDMLQRKSHDSCHCTAVFNERRQEMQFFSARLSKETSSTATSKSRFNHHQQPATYVMVADEYMLYHVLLVQDAFRKYHLRKQRGQKLRGIAKCARWFAKELLAARKRIQLHAEIRRKQTLNCIHIIVERAQHLRAGDLFASDPFVIVTVFDVDDNEITKGKTSVRHNTLNPKWNEEFKFQFEWQEFVGKALEDSLLGEFDAFEVCDYDIVVLKKGKRESSSSGGSDDDESGVGTGLVDSAIEKKLEKGDLLGQASIPIESLDHGNLVSIVLTLSRAVERDNSGEAVEPANGTLSVSVQWMHSAEFDASEPHKLSLDAKNCVEAKKKPLLKQKLPGELVHDLRGIHMLFEKTLEVLLDLGSSTLDPLQRLNKRMLDAQAVGKTAEEVKVVEQRMFVLIKTQLIPKMKSVDDHVPLCSELIQRFVQNSALVELIQEYVDSQESEEYQELTEIKDSILDGISKAVQELQVLLTQSETSGAASDCSQDLKKVGVCFETAFRRRQILKTWSHHLDRTLTTFFILDQEKELLLTPLNSAVDDLYSKMEAQTSSLSTAAVSIAALGSPTGVQAPQSPVKGPAKSAASAEKRLERIQKEKRKK